MKKVQILIVEDDAIVARDIQGRLKNLGYSVSGIVNYAEKAIEKIEAFKPELVLMDIVLKGETDGIEAAEIIRSRFDIPVVFLTAYADEERFARAKLTIPFGYILKPFQDRDLKITIEMAIYTAKVNAERKQTEEALRESEGKFRSICASAQDAILMMNIKGNISYWNDAAEKIFGYSSKEALDQDLHMLLVPPHYHKAFNKGFSGFKTTGQGPVIDQMVEVEAVKKDGTKFPVELSVSATKLEGEWNAIGMIRDISERKQAEADRKMLNDELKLLNIGLEDKVKDRTVALELAVLEAEAGNRAKSDFLANMSHELRTPLNSIIGFSQILQEKSFGDLNEKQESYIRHILESGEHLLELISDVLDLAKVESGKEMFEPTRVNIESLLENSLVMIKEKASKHAIDLDLHIVPELADLEIKADERKLKQVIYNLLSNAVKFTPDGGNVRVSARIVVCRLPIADLKEMDSNQQCIEICVADSGVGIASEDQEKIFAEFYQVQDDVRYTPEGTGLGLAISKRFVEMHGGKIWVESEGKDKGSRFSFIFPIIPGHLEEAQTEAGEDSLVIAIEAEATLRHNKPFTLCRLWADKEHLKQEKESIKKVLEEEKRGLDSIVMEKDDNLYLILKETDRQQAKAACNRFSEKLEEVLEGRKVSWSMATFPDDEEDAVTLLKKVGSQAE